MDVSIADDDITANPPAIIATIFLPYLDHNGRPVSPGHVHPGHVSPGHVPRDHGYQGH